jgi:hypothetical protein
MTVAASLLADETDWWAFCIAALSGTHTIVYQICAAEHDIPSYPRSDTESNQISATAKIQVSKIN